MEEYPLLNAITLYRLARWCWKRKIPFVPQFIKLLTFVVYNSSVPYQAKIGRGSTLDYGGIGVVIHRRAEIGENVVIGTGVTIGGRSSSERVPRIGNNVYLATGSKVLGDITIGDFVVVGANAVVIHSVPSNSVVAGVPGRILKRDIAEQDYRRMT